MLSPNRCNALVQACVHTETIHTLTKEGSHKKGEIAEMTLKAFTVFFGY